MGSTTRDGCPASSPVGTVATLDLDRVRSRLTRVDPQRIDLLFALLLAGLSLIGHRLVGHPDVRPPDAMGTALILTQTLPLARRRQFPVQVLIVTGIATALYAATGQRSTAAYLGVLFALYTVAAHTDRETALHSVGWTFVGIVVSFIAASAASPEPVPIPLVIERLSQNLLIFGAAWLLGSIVRSRREYGAQLERRNAEIVLEREENARLAVSEERARIARELHDVVAHHVSVMVVQAGAARRSLESRRALATPDDPVLQALESLETTGRQTLAEMRRMLGGLRTDESDSRTPQPGIERLPDLIEQVRDAGLPVQLTIEGTPVALPAGIDLSAYRIVQEALTNTLKHGGRARARVLLRYAGGALEVEVLDDGRGAAAGLVEPSPHGHGLIGMRERVAILGGSLEAGPRLSGGYLVSARLPIEAGGVA
jgi:signal transduction histidine kinase